MSTKHDQIIDLLTDIVGSAIEYDMHYEPNRFIFFIDLYRVYLRGLQSSGEGKDSDPVTFQQFIFNQTLIDTAASTATFETGERLKAPTALHFKRP